VGITLDGVGYGDDGQSWGGEILIGGYREYRRNCHLTPVPMIGGDLCAKFPGRMLLSLLLMNQNKDDTIDMIDRLNHKLHLEDNFPQKKLEFDFVLRQGHSVDPSNKEQFPLTSSMGRWLDAVSSLFDVSHIRTYRGEPAMRLEGYIWNGIPQKHFDLDDYMKSEEILSHKLFYDYVDLYVSKFHDENKSKKVNLACSMVNDISSLFGRTAVNLAEINGINHIGISGGVAYNDRIVSVIKNIVDSNNLIFLQNKNIPCGDAGISIGQISVASSRYI